MRAWAFVDVPRLPGAREPLRLFDTATGTVHPTQPGPTARMYVCGITPYDATHMGHAATYIAFDLVQRQWRDAGHDVYYAQNVTDIDDPLLERANQTGQDWEAIAEREVALFREDMSALRVLPPDHFVGVVESIPEIAERVQALLDAGHAYRVDDDVYFSKKDDPRFGQVAHLDNATMRALFAERGGDPDRPGKHDPLDWCLWKAARPGEPSWPSPLGDGRPGWHIECSTIALDHLGMPIDVQGGGSDLAFPHHEMGASEVQMLTGEHPFAHHYVHAGMVAWQGHKMSKSRGNLVFVSKLREAGIDPMAIRLAVLAHHYYSDWTWTDQGLDGAVQRLERWRQAVTAERGPDALPVLAKVRAAMSNDLRTPEALDAIDDWTMATLQGEGDDARAPALVADLADALLGVRLS